MKSVVLSESDLEKAVSRKRFDVWNERNKSLVSQLSYASNADSNFVVWEAAIIDFLHYCKAFRDDCGVGR